MSCSSRDTRPAAAYATKTFDQCAHAY